MSTGNDLKKYAVLYVDDEEQALKYFPKLFGGDLRCLTAASVAEARKVIEREGDGIGVVISDQRMPGESGVELLSWLRATRPQVVRLLTTAYSDLDSAIAAVNSGAIFRYVVKPWEHRELYGVLARAMEFHIVTRERDTLLQEKLTSLQRIVMMDRRRGFAVLAAGLSARVRNPLSALRQYLLSAPPAAPVAASGADSDLWQAAERESHHLFALSEMLGRQVLDPRPLYVSGLTVAELISPAYDDARSALGPGASLAIAAGTPAINADREMAIRLLRLLVALALRVQGPGGTLALRAAAANTGAAVRITITGGPAAWGQAQIATLYAAVTASADGRGCEADLLAAYLLAFHHAGTLVVHPGAPAGPGFELTLPLDPALSADLVPAKSWIDDLLTFQQDD
jgi:two-component system probable response regulator PhcQ